jgi:hypothetical protein
MRARTYPAAPRSVNRTCPRISVVMPGATCIGAVWALSRERSGLAGRNVSALIEAGMSAQSDPRRAVTVGVDPRYYYRRSLSLREMMPAIGAAVVAAAATFYVAKVFLERTPLRSEPAARDRSPSRTRLRLHHGDADGSIVDRNLGRR